MPFSVIRFRNDTNTEYSLSTAVLLMIGLGKQIGELILGFAWNGVLEHTLAA